MDLIKVQFEYSDGSYKYLEGAELEKWMSFNTIVSSIAEKHGVNPPWQDIQWIKIGKDKHY